MAKQEKRCEILSEAKQASGEACRERRRNAQTRGFYGEKAKQVFRNVQLVHFRKKFNFFNLKFLSPETQKSRFSGICRLFIIFDHVLGFVTTAYNKLKTHFRDGYVRPPLKYLHTLIFGHLLKTGQCKKIPLFYDVSNSLENSKTEFVRKSAYTFIEYFYMNYCCKPAKPSAIRRKSHCHIFTNVSKISKLS